MSKSKVFIFIAISFALGILAASKFSLPNFHLFVAGAILIAFFGISFYSKKNKLTLAALFLFCACLGAFRLNLASIENEYKSMFGGKHQLEGYIVEDIDIRTDKQLLTFLPKGYNQRLLITAPLSQEYFYGDWIVVNGKIDEPKNFEDFDYQKYLERFDIYGVSRYPKILVLKNHQQNFIKESLLRVKYAFTKRVGKMFKEPQGSLLLGIIIGAKKALPQDLVDDFQATGTTHIIAISGFNITIIVAALSFLAKYIGRKNCFWLTLSVIAGFVVLTGASASVLRAGLMGFMLIVSLQIGRQYAVVPALFLSGLFMLILNPKILFWDMGFQLSFAATLGIVYFYPLFARLTKDWINPLSLKDNFFTTISAIIATLPLIALTFGRISLVAPLANVLILPFLPLTMLLGFLSVLPFVGPGFAYTANFFLVYIIKTVAILSSWRFSSIDVNISLWMFWLMVCAVGVIYALLHFAAKNIKKDENQPVEFRMFL